MTRAFLGLGSNLDDRRAILRSAVEGLGTELRAVSGLYETEPVGGPQQGAFLNLVVELDTTADPESLLARCQALEQVAGRERTIRWGPRTLDVDILWIDGVELDTPTLQVPHPRMFERRFVMAPLAELAPELLPRGWQDVVTGNVHRLGDLFEPTPGGDASACEHEKHGERLA